MATSIKCGCCREVHASVAEVKDCYAQEADAAAEYAAEMAAERYYEEGGANGWMEAAAFEEWEAAHGMVPFHVAMAEADARTTR